MITGEEHSFGMKSPLMIGCHSTLVSLGLAPALTRALRSSCCNTNYNHYQFDSKQCQISVFVIYITHNSINYSLFCRNLMLLVASQSVYPRGKSASSSGVEHSVLHLHFPIVQQQISQCQGWKQGSPG